MHETWLHPNRRAILFGCLLPIGIAVLGGLITFWPGVPISPLRTMLGVALLLAAALSLFALLSQLVRPRISYRERKVLFNLRAGNPIAVPVEFVEAFFLGQGPAYLAGDSQGREETVNLVARLSQRQSDWATRDVKQALGEWKDGYITIRGTWCEPLNNEVIRRLNRRLKEVKSLADVNATHVETS